MLACPIMDVPGSNSVFLDVREGHGYLSMLDNVY